MELREIEERIRREYYFVETVLKKMRKVIVGQDYLLTRLLIGLLKDGHILVEGVPGLAKTLAVRTFAKVLKLSFSRIQFTPDLLPADLIGTLIYNPETKEFTPKLGPIFANIVLADEINRAPAKVQSALLEAMQERQVTIGENTYKLPEPFLVLATQNPIEQEGTYPLPEAQIDRFMLKLKITYPKKEEEKEIIDRVAIKGLPQVESAIGEEELKRAKEAVNIIYVDERIKNYVVDIVFATRNPEEYGLDDLKRFIDYGASPRASIYLIQSSQALAFIKQRGFVVPEDVKEIAYDVLRHRIILSYEAEAEEITQEKIIEEILNVIPVP